LSRAVDALGIAACVAHLYVRIVIGQAASHELWAKRKACSSQPKAHRYYSVQVCDTKTSPVQAATLRLNAAIKTELRNERGK